MFNILRLHSKLNTKGKYSTFVVNLKTYIRVCNVRFKFHSIAYQCVLIDSAPTVSVRSVRTVANISHDPIAHDKWFNCPPTHERHPICTHTITPANRISAYSRTFNSDRTHRQHRHRHRPPYVWRIFTITETECLAGSRWRLWCRATESRNGGGGNIIDACVGGSKVVGISVGQTQPAQTKWDDSGAHILCVVSIYDIPPGVVIYWRIVRN